MWFVINLLIIFLAVMSIVIPRSFLWIGASGFAGTCLGIIAGIFRNNRYKDMLSGSITGAVLVATVAFHVFDYKDGPYGQIHAIIWFGIIGGIAGILFVTICGLRAKGSGAKQTPTD